MNEENSIIEACIVN